MVATSVPFAISRTVVAVPFEYDTVVVLELAASVTLANGRSSGLVSVPAAG